MLDILSIISVIFFGGWLGIGIRWGFWVWDSVAEIIRNRRDRRQSCRSGNP